VTGPSSVRLTPLSLVTVNLIPLAKVTAPRLPSRQINPLWV
jgi:hypothetical protein